MLRLLLVPKEAGHLDWPSTWQYGNLELILQSAKLNLLAQESWSIAAQCHSEKLVCKCPNPVVLMGTGNQRTQSMPAWCGGSTGGGRELQLSS